MLVMVSFVLESVEYLHSISCRHRLPLYDGSSTSCLSAFHRYPMALIMSGLWCIGLLCLGRRLVGIIVGCGVFSLSFWSPSFVASRASRVGSICGIVLSIFVCVLKSLTVLVPRSMLTMGHLPPLCFSSCSCRSLNVLLCRDVRSLALCLHPPNI